MGTGLLTSTGFDPKRLADVIADLETRFKAEFGDAVNLTADTELGKLMALQADREASIWERLEEEYDAHTPSTATGVSLDLVAEISGSRRNPVTRSTVTLYVRGAVVTIPIQSLVETLDTGIQFRTTAEITLPAEHKLSDVAEGGGNDLVQTAGTATVTYPSHGFSVGEFIYFKNCDQPEYNGLKTILTVADVNTFTFAIDSGATSPATGTVDGFESFAVDGESVDTGTVAALAETLTVIVTPISVGRENLIV